MADIERKQESIRLEPRIVMDYKSLELSFKIGFSKMFVVKDLAELTDAVENRETLLYGKDTYINHQMDNFTQESRRWLSFISKAVEEERMIDARINSHRWHYDVDSLKCSSISLYGWRIDKLYDLLGEEGCEYETKEQGTKKKYILHRRQRNPEISMLIDKSKDRLDKEFHGIEVNCTLPHFYHGNETSYYIQGTWLSKIDREFMDKVQLLLALEKGDKLHFRVGRNYLQDFYYNMLPQLEDVVQVEEKDKEEIEKYLPPEVKFVFYLDQIKGNIVCKVHAIYGEREISILDLLNNREEAKSQNYRIDIVNIG